MNDDAQRIEHLLDMIELQSGETLSKTSRVVARGVLSGALKGMESAVAEHLAMEDARRFGAIRRAAQEARLADEDNSYTAHVAAQEIRRAIRAAIGSPKA